MPTYEYRCADCGELTEAFQKMSDAPLVVCPHCGHESLTRIVSGGAGVIYKGEGWYVTDYSKKSSGGKDIEAKPSSASKSADSGKTESTSTADTPKPEASKSDTPKPPASSGGGATSNGGSSSAKAGS